MPSSIIPASLGAQGDGDGGPDDLLDDRRVDCDPAGDLGRPVFLKEARGEPQEVAVDGKADVGDDALAEPADEIEADRCGQRHDDHQKHQILEPAGDVPAGETLVDDQLEGIGDARCRRGGNQQGDRGAQDMAGIPAGEPPDHAEARERLALGSVRGNGHRRCLAVCPHCLNCRVAAGAVQQLGLRQEQSGPTTVDPC
jgi:hypothetical protein